MSEFQTRRDELLLKCFARISAKEQNAVIKLAADLAGEPIPPDLLSDSGEEKVAVWKVGQPPDYKPPSHGYGVCADCGEHAHCYTRKGIPRCDHCRRKIPFRKDDEP